MSESEIRGDTARLPGAAPSTALITAGDIAADRGLRFIEALQLPDGMTFYTRFRSDPWLRDEIFRPALSRTAEGLPRHPLIWNELPKGSMKTTALAALALAEGVLEPGTHTFIVATDTDQGRLTLEALASMIAQSPWLQGEVKQTRTEFRLPGGSWVRVMSSDAPSFHGVAVTSRRVRLYADELTQFLDRPLWDAMLATLPKIRDSQLLAATNAGVSASWQSEAKQQMEDAGARMFVTAPGWLPSWISRSSVNAMKKTLPVALHQRYFENRWVQAESSFIDMAEWAACSGTIPAYQQEEIVLAVDGALRHDSFAICGVSRHPDPSKREDSVCVRVTKTWTPTPGHDVDFAEPFAWLQDYIAANNVVQIAYDPYQLHDFMSRLRAATGAWCREFQQGPPRAKSDVLLFALIADGRLLHGEPAGGEIVPDSLTDHASNSAFQISTGLEQRGRLVKSKPGKRIDLMVALSMCSSESLRLIL